MDESRLRRPPRERNGSFKHGRYTQETKQIRGRLRQMRRNAETMLATALNAHGLKPPVQLRRRSHVKKALAEALVRGQPEPKPPDVLQQIEQIIEDAIRPK